jgi:RNA polymerase sigma-70 factor (ECF subfamily)
VKITLTDDREPVVATGSADADPSRTGPESDHELWERLRAGDHFALGELFDRYTDDVRAFAFRRTASWSTADDVVQATFLSSWGRFRRNPPGPLTGTSARGWLLVVAGNECRTLRPYGEPAAQPGGPSSGTGPFRRPRELKLGR